MTLSSTKNHYVVKITHTGTVLLETRSKLKIKVFFRLRKQLQAAKKIEKFKQSQNQTKLDDKNKNHYHVSANFVDLSSLRVGICSPIFRFPHKNPSGVNKGNDVNIKVVTLIISF